MKIFLSPWSPFFPFILFLREVAHKKNACLRGLGQYLICERLKGPIEEMGFFGSEEGRHPGDS